MSMYGKKVKTKTEIKKMKKQSQRTWIKKCRDNAGNPNM